jgi:hypothetical protein
MFDPTAFDNMKVVIEGAAYDLDLSGEIKIIDRKDLVDLATMSRMYQLKLSLGPNEATYATLTLNASVEQIASELLTIHSLQQGSYISLTFSWIETENKNDINEIIKQLWGNHRSYDERKIISSIHGIRREIIIEFNRIVTEEMLDDLLDMMHHAVKTLQKLS